jgi:hypothetical protein
MKKKLDAEARRMRRLVLLSVTLRGIAGMDPNVSRKEAKAMDADELEDRLRDFGRWFKEHCMNQTASVENALYAALDDEENTQIEGPAESGLSNPVKTHE